MKKVRQILSLLLMAMLILSLITACNPGASTTGVSTTTSATPTTSGSAGTTTTGSTYTGPTDKAKADENVTLSVFVSNGRIWKPELENHKAIMEKLNITLDVEVSAKPTEDLALRFASGDIWDIIYFPGFSFIEYLDTGYLMPLNELLPEYGQNILSTTTEYAMDICTIGSTIYCYPHENNNSKYRVAVRKDWLDKLNIDLSKHAVVEGSDIHYITLDEYTEIMRAFAKDDPDGNGKDDTYGLGAMYASKSANAQMHIMGAFNGSVGQAYDYNGTVKYYETSDDYRQALQYLNSQWTAGVIDPEFFLADGKYTRVMQGNIGSWVTWWSSPYQTILDGMRDIVPDVEWTPVLVQNGNSVGMMDNGRLSGTIAISSKCENPVRAMQLIDYLKTDEGWYQVRYGIEGLDYDFDNDGYPIRTEAGTKKFSEMTLDTLYMICDRLELVNFADSAPQKDPIMQLRRTWNMYQFVDSPLYSNLFYGLQTTEASKTYLADVQNYVMQWNMKFITGEVELNDANWQTYLTGWKSMGGSDILKSFVELYNEKNGTKLVPGM